MENYIKLKENNHKLTHIETRVYYDLGGTDFFAGRGKARGYYLAVAPVEYAAKNGLVSVCFTAFTGYKYLLKEVARQSKKAAREAEKSPKKSRPQLLIAYAKKTASKRRRDAMKAKHQNRETLLYILYSYKRMIERGAADFPRVVLDDLRRSLDDVLTRNEYTAADYTNHRTKDGASL